VDELSESCCSHLGPQSPADRLADDRRWNDVADAIGSTFCAVIDSARAIGAAVQTVASGVEGGPQNTSAAILESLEPCIESVIERHGGILIGAGFVADPGFLKDASHWMDWRLAGEGAFARLEVSHDVDDVANYDYTTSRWFGEPKRGADVAIVGPYVDYGGTNAYVVTVTVPVRSGDRFLGVAGADVSVDRVEAVLRRMTRDVGIGAMIVTKEGRIVASSAPRHYPGTLLRHLDGRRRTRRDAQASTRVLDCPGLPWRLVVLGCEDPSGCSPESACCALA